MSGAIIQDIISIEKAIQAIERFETQVKQNLIKSIDEFKKHGPDFKIGNRRKEEYIVLMTTQKYNYYDEKLVQFYKFFKKLQDSVEKFEITKETSLTPQQLDFESNKGSICLDNFKKIKSSLDSLKEKSVYLSKLFNENDVFSEHVISKIKDDEIIMKFVESKKKELLLNNLISLIETWLENYVGFPKMIEENEAYLNGFLLESGGWTTCLACISPRERTYSANPSAKRESSDEDFNYKPLDSDGASSKRKSKKSKKKSKRRSKRRSKRKSKRYRK